ncbi:MAG: DUF47 family protein [Candidatus Omnitrophica bacterium]|nr:DUF47 family protein [Candidatus Omnitrophota bacterium]
MLSIFLPKEFNYFNLFEKQVDYAVDAARFFKELVSRDNINEDALSKMEEIEHQGDETTHAIIAQLNKTFITPIDREDIHALAKEMDDIIDMINTIVNRMVIYQLDGVNIYLVEVATVIEASVTAVAVAIKGLRNPKNIKSVQEACVEVNRLENVGDTMRDKVLAELFETEKDPIMVIKLKDIYQDAETILDICEDVVNVVESILVK